MGWLHFVFGDLLFRVAPLNAPQPSQRGNHLASDTCHLIFYFPVLLFLALLVPDTSCHQVLGNENSCTKDSFEERDDQTAVT